MFLDRGGLLAAEDFGEIGAPVWAARPQVVAHPSSGGRYGEGQRPGFTAMILAVGVHAAIVPVLLGLGYQAVAHREERLVAVDLTPAAPPPPAPAPSVPEPQKLQTRVTPPPVELAAENVQPVALALGEADFPAERAQPIAVSAPPVAASGLPAVASLPVVAADLGGSRMVSGSAPRYPRESRRKKEQGTVELQLLLDADGGVEAISVSRSSGFARLDEAALAAVRRWRWQPTLRSGVAVKVRGLVEIPFVLQSA